MTEHVVIEDTGSGEILVLSRQDADNYQYPNLVVHTGHTCDRESGFSESEAKELAEKLHATGVRGTYRR